MYSGKMKVFYLGISIVSAVAVISGNPASFCLHFFVCLIATGLHICYTLRSSVLLNPVVDGVIPGVRTDELPLTIDAVPFVLRTLLQDLRASHHC